MDIFSSENKDQFKELGFAALKSAPGIVGYLDDIKEEISELACSYGFVDPFGNGEVQFDPPKGEDRNRFYRSLRYLPSLGRLANSNLLADASKQIGLSLPLVMNASNIRMDQGGHNPNKFHWHQDYTYLLGSLNSVTYWLPLQPVSATLGGIEIVPGSHKENLRQFKIVNEAAKMKTGHLSPNDLELAQEPTEQKQAVELEYGDGIVFSQFLLHRSLEHASPHTRWTVQVRVSDALETHYREFGCPMGDTTTILQHDDLRSKLVQSS